VLAIMEFASVVDAVECAVNIQRGMAEQDARLADDQRIDVLEPSKPGRSDPTNLSRAKVISRRGAHIGTDPAVVRNF